MKRRARVTPVALRRERWRCAGRTEDRFFLCSTGEFLLALGPKITEQQREWILELLGGIDLEREGVTGFAKEPRRDPATGITDGSGPAER